MAKKKQYYVVIHGRRPGLYDRWFGEEGAAEQVDGLADAVYKGFYTLQEAAEWLRELHAQGQTDRDLRFVCDNCDPAILHLRSRRQRGNRRVPGGSLGSEFSWRQSELPPAHPSDYHSP